MEEPKRLSSGGGELAQMLAAAEEDVLEQDRVDRVRAGLRAAGVLGGAAAMGGGASKLIGGASLKIGAALLLGGVLTAIAVHHFTGQEAAPITPPIVTPIATPIPTPTPTPAPIPTPSAIPIPTPTVTPSATSLPSVVRHAAPTKSAAPVATAPSPREGMLLLQARQSLASDPQHTLDLIRAHEREFPVSQLQPERDKLRADAIAAGAK